MSEIISGGLEKLLSLGFGQLSVGVRPSGEIHIGTVITIMNGLLYLKENPSSEMTITLHDLFGQLKLRRNFVPCMYHQDRLGCHETAREHSKDEINDFLRDAASYLGIDLSRIKINYMSDILASEHARYAIAGVLKDVSNRKKLKKIVNGGSKTKSDRQPFYVICPECDYGTNEFTTYKARTESFRSRCHNEGCGNTDGYEFKIIDTTVQFAPYYLINVFRDMIGLPDKPKADLHLFGGDKLEVTGTTANGNNISIAEKCIDIMGMFGPNVPHIYIGPIILNHGIKLSKSAGPQFTYRQMRNSGTDVQSIVRMIEDIGGQMEYDIARQPVLCI